ncbi:hypothetical protein [Vibrio sp. ABG19]|uniref:PKD domain-containing protein n=1 Tax=Vibrio sp. ABG19 TaxID=2817385 RepID=UPI00249EFC59|nr:hypothetical protein [Vibrio sp. ABG19]WGY46803.1 hypothetical protein J0X00_18625 [Vibrio sp. ABG19]
MFINSLEEVCAGRHYLALRSTCLITAVGIALMSCISDVNAYEAHADLIQAFDTSNYPSPDPAGIVYLPSDDSLIITDSEINEMAIFPPDQTNVFKIDRSSGVLLKTYSTISFSDEPTGITINTDNNHCFISDDTGPKSVYEIAPGNDGICLTEDDSVSAFSTEAFGSSDPEDITYGQGSLYVMDGISHIVYRITPGPNGVFDGVTVDDVVNSFDARELGLTDPESIYFDAMTSTLYIISSTGQFIVQSTTEGHLLRTIDISQINPKKPSGITIAPSSLDPSLNSIFMSARGWDNDSDPTENDGMIYEITLPPYTQGNAAPEVFAGDDLAVVMPALVNLTGSVTDDGLPANSLTTSWSKISGQGDVVFSDPGSTETTASFSAAGDYILRLTAFDGELQSEDEVTVNVSAQEGVFTLTRRINASNDDAEELATGRMRTVSSDLELVYDGSNQVVGLRFNTINIPQGATINSAYIQFQADEVKSVDTTLTIRGELSASATAFQKETANISARIATTSAIYWSPAPWLIVGEADLDQRTPDLGPIIAEITSQSGWAEGNSLAILISGDGERVAESFDGDQAGAPLLYIEYSYVPGNQPPLVEAGQAQTITLSQSAVLTGAVSDDGIPGDTLTQSWNKISGQGSVNFTNASSAQTSATFSLAGIYVLRLTASDGDLTNFDDVEITVTQDGLQTLSRRIAASSDDAEEKADGSVKTNSSDLELVYDGSNQVVGMRFTQIDVPQGANIVGAYIQFQADETKAVETTLLIQGELAANPVTFVRESHNVSSRVRTAASVTWTPPEWRLVGESDSKQKTPDISAIISEVTSQAGWVPGNALVVIVTGIGERVAEAYDGEPDGAPIIHIEYTLND